MQEQDNQTLMTSQRSSTTTSSTSLTG